MLNLDAQTTLSQVVSFAAQQPWSAPDPARADDLRLVLEELLSNVVRHAFAGHTAPQGVCAVQLQAGRVLVELRDNGPPFDPFDLRNTPGYGLALIRALARNPEYRYRAGENYVSLCLTSN